MREKLISFETAKLANKVGFYLVDSCITYYSKEGVKHTIKSNLSLDDRINLHNKILLAPRQSLLQKWLREVHSIIIFVEHETIDDSESGYTWCVKKYVEDGVEGTRKKKEPDFWKVCDSFNEQQMWWNIYEEALEKGLKKALELI